MDKVQFSQDDVFDVVELVDKIEASIDEIIKDQPKFIAMSAVISASINSIIKNCSSIPEIVKYYEIFKELMDASISNIYQQISKIKKETNS